VTFVPSWSLDTGPVVYLECDGCGDAVQPSFVNGRDSAELWTRAQQAGWVAVAGRHHCPSCAARTVNKPGDLLAA
jgi:hypothetical protein